MVLVYGDTHTVGTHRILLVASKKGDATMVCHGRGDVSRILRFLVVPMTDITEIGWYVPPWV